MSHQLDERMPPLSALTQQVESWATADEWLDLLSEAITEHCWPVEARVVGIEFIDEQAKREAVKRQCNLAALRHALRTEDHIATGALLRRWLSDYCRRVARTRHPYAEDDE